MSSKNKINHAWKYFQKKEKNKAECNLCHSIVAFCANTTNLMSHLRMKQKDLNLIPAVVSGDEKEESDEVAKTVKTESDEVKRNSNTGSGN